MGRERRVTREDAEDFMAQIQRATESGADETTVNALGAEIAFSRQSDGGFTFTTPDGSMSSRLHQAAEARPTEYPDDMPFIPNEPVSVLSTGNAVTLLWFAPGEPATLFDELNGQSRSEGWELKEESEFAQVPVRHSEYESDGLSRSILISGGMVSLIQKRH